MLFANLLYAVSLFLYLNIICKVLITGGFKMKGTINYNAVGLRVKVEREKLGYTREVFSEMVGIAPVYLGQIERAERKMSLDTFVKVASSLNVTLDYLIYGDESYDISKNELIDIINNRTKRELNVLSKVLKALFQNLKK
jgi:transcriptional regulator with XRE-family HTH domain